jgi:Rod binding domain-containing protein
VLLQVKNGEHEELPRATQAKLGKLKKATQDLEALMLKDLIGKMRAGTTANKPDPMKQLAHEMFDEQLAASVSQTGRVGIASVVFNRLSSQIVNADLSQGLLAPGRIDLQG